MPFVPGVTSTAMGHTNPSTSRRPLSIARRPTNPSTAPQRAPEPIIIYLPPHPATLKRPAQLNLNINNQSQAGRFPHSLFENNQNAPQRYSTISQFISQYPPTPAGLSYRVVNPVSNSSSAANINNYTTVLNNSGLFPEKLSAPDSATINILSRDVAPNTPIYQVDGRDAANWLWNRRGLQLTDAQWDRMHRARQSVLSQLHKIPQTTYFTWSNNDNINAYSHRFSGNKDINNQFVHVFNPNYFNQTHYSYRPYSGYNIASQQGKSVAPWRQFMNFQDMQDHELSHSFNNITPITVRHYPNDSEQINGVNKGNMFFRRTNNPEQPYYDDATTEQRVQNFSNLFKGTYLERPGEYIGAMGRVKRYGAELGFDTTNPDPVKARAAMAQTLHYLANHQKPEELTQEQQRIHGWLNVAAENYRARQNALQNTNENNYTDNIQDVQSPFYMNVLDFMTDATIQGLVRNNVPSNNANALQNLRYGYA